MSSVHDYSRELQIYKYVLIDFPDENYSLAVVCTSWIYMCAESSVTKCYWPGSLNANNFAKKNVAPLNTWKIFNCNIKRFYHTYEDGHKGLNSYTSDESYIDYSKRKIFPNKRFHSSSDEESQDLSKDLNVSIQNGSETCVNYKEVNNYGKNKKIKTFSMPPMPVNKTSTSHYSDEVNNIGDLSNGLFCLENNDIVDEESLIVSIPDNIPDIEKKDNTCDLFKKISDQYQEIQTTLNIIKIDIADIQKQLDQQAYNVRGMERIDDINLKFPLKSLSEINELEKSLAEDTNKILETKLINTLLRVGSSKSPTKTTNNILKKVMTNRLADSFNMTGKGDKGAFGNLKLSKIIQGVVYTLQGITETEYTTYLSLWLRQSANRS